MNYFEIINATLIELNYNTVNSFENLSSLEHKRLMNIINRLNKEICNQNSKFHFRQMVKNLTIFKEKTEYTKPFMGKIISIYGNNSEYLFEQNHAKFYTEHLLKNTYGTFGTKLLFSPQDDKLKIFYSTENFVLDKNGENKSDFTEGTDKSIIPDTFAEKLLINGAAYNFKQNTSHPKYIHWKKEYDNALAQLMAEAKNTSNSELKINGGFRKL